MAKVSIFFFFIFFLLKKEVTATELQSKNQTTVHRWVEIL